MIYLFGNQIEALCKIGFTERSVNSRLVSVQTGCPFQLQVLGLIEGSRRHEAELHNLFAKHRKSGEWFEYTKEIQEYFNHVADTQGFKHNIGVDYQSKDSMFYTFGDQYELISKLKGVSDWKVIQKLVTISEYNTGKVSLTTEVRKRILAELKMSSPNFSKSIRILKQMELVTGEGSNLRLDPRWFWKGDLKTREKLLN